MGQGNFLTGMEGTEKERTCIRPCEIFGRLENTVVEMPSPRGGGLPVCFSENLPLPESGYPLSFFSFRISSPKKGRI